MLNQPKIVAFDVDSESLTSLRYAFPKWEVEVIRGASRQSLAQDWAPAVAALLVVGARDQVAETLGLCRGLRSQTGRARTPLLVLVSSAQEPLVGAALEAGANSCMVLPVDVKTLVSMVGRARQGNRPGRHTIGLDRAQLHDQWRDDGGEA